MSWLLFLQIVLLMAWGVICLAALSDIVRDQVVKAKLKIVQAKTRKQWEC